MLGLVSTFDRQGHTFIGGEIGPWVAKLGKEANRDLAVVRYEKLGVFCIIEFLSPARDVFVDVKNIGKSLGNFGREAATELRQRMFRPVTCDQTSEFITENESRYHHDRQDDNSAEWERQGKIERGE